MYNATNMGVKNKSKKKIHKSNSKKLFSMYNETTIGRKNKNKSKKQKGGTMFKFRKSDLSCLQHVGLDPGGGNDSCGACVINQLGFPSNMVDELSRMALGRGVLVDQVVAKINELKILKGVGQSNPTKVYWWGANPRNNNELIVIPHNPYNTPPLNIAPMPEHLVREAINGVFGTLSNGNANILRIDWSDDVAHYATIAKNNKGTIFLIESQDNGCIGYKRGFDEIYHYLANIRSAAGLPMAFGTFNDSQPIHNGRNWTLDFSRELELDLYNPERPTPQRVDNNRSINPMDRDSSDEPQPPTSPATLLPPPTATAAAVPHMNPHSYHPSSIGSVHELGSPALRHIPVIPPQEGRRGPIYDRLRFSWQGRTDPEQNIFSNQNPPPSASTTGLPEEEELALALEQSALEASQRNNRTRRAARTAETDRQRRQRRQAASQVLPSSQPPTATAASDYTIGLPEEEELALALEQSALEASQRNNRTRRTRRAGRTAETDRQRRQIMQRRQRRQAASQVLPSSQPPTATAASAYTTGLTEEEELALALEQSALEESQRMIPGYANAGTPDRDAGGKSKKKNKSRKKRKNKKKKSYKIENNHKHKSKTRIARGAPSTGIEDMPNEMLGAIFENSSLDELANLYHTNHLLRANAIQIVRTRFSNAEKIEELFYASRNGNTEIVELLLAAGTHVNRYPIGVDINFTEPLVEASREGHTEIVRMLINAGADVNGSDAFGTTPLMEAMAENHMGIVIMLRQAGAQQ